jgi:hypothetical protein
MDTVPVTLTMRQLRPPTREELLLTEAARSLGGLPADAFVLAGLDGVPHPVRRVIKMAQHMGRPVSAWRDESGGHWLFVGELVTRRGTAVFAVDQYSSAGELIGRGLWRQDSRGQWQSSADDDSSALP